MYQGDEDESNLPDMEEEEERIGRINDFTSSKLITYEPFRPNSS